MTTFEMVKYHNQKYPAGIPLRIEEIAAHLNATQINASLGRFLHTEYSYGKRNYNSALIKYFPVLAAANKDGVPQLWKNSEWADTFASFIFKLNGTETAPRVIEIHPPFSDYTDMAGFVENYSIFEESIHSQFPDTEILIENRCGSVYRGGKFILSKIKDVAALCESIEAKRLRLRIAFDVPQIYTAHNASTEDKYLTLLQEAKPYSSFIGGVHLWGKSYSSTGRKVSHCGDLNSYFGNQNAKECFLEAFADCFNDNMARKMVLEVNSGNDDLSSIIYDLLSVGIKFV